MVLCSTEESMQIDKVHAAGHSYDGSSHNSTEHTSDAVTRLHIMLKDPLTSFTSSREDPNSSNNSLTRGMLPPSAALRSTVLPHWARTRRSVGALSYYMWTHHLHIQEEWDGTVMMYKHDTKALAILSAHQSCEAELSTLQIETSIESHTSY